MNCYNFPLFFAWCSGILPTVFDDSLTYYEQVCRLIHGLEELRKDLENIDINYADDIKKLKEYVDNKISNLNAELRHYFDNKTTEIIDEVANYQKMTQEHYNNIHIWIKQIWSELAGFGNDTMVQNPATGRIDSLQNVLNMLYYHIFQEALTCAEYAALNLTCESYANKEFSIDGINYTGGCTCDQYLKYGKTIFIKQNSYPYSWFFMVHPTTGETVFYQEVINWLAAFHLRGLTCQEYADLDYTCNKYETLDWTCGFYADMSGANPL